MLGGADDLQPKRAAKILLPLLDALDETGANADELLVECRLEREALKKSDLRLPVALVFDVFRRAEERTGDATLGCRAGLMVRPGVFDVYDYTVRNASTLGEAAADATRFARLLDDTYEPRMMVDGDVASLGYARYEDEPDALAEFVLATVVTIVRQVSGHFVAPDRVTLRRDFAGSSEPFEALLGCPVTLRSSEDRLFFPSSYLALPVDHADPKLHAVLERHAADLLSRLPEVSSLAARVRGLLASELQGGNPSIVYIAEKMGTSPRTLRRRLSEEGTTHQKLLDELRCSLSERYLAESSLTISKVAGLLGFSNPSAFNRAFKRWHGKTPDEYRRVTPLRR